MNTPSEAPAPVLLDKLFLDKIAVGDRLFHYLAKGGPASSFRHSPSAEYTLYSVIDLPTRDEIVLMRAFDTKEHRRTYSRSDLLNGEWWHMSHT